MGIETQCSRDAVDDVFNNEHALRAAEATKCRLRSFVCIANPAAGVKGWNQVRVVAMKQGAPEHGFGEIETPAAIRIEIEFHAAQHALVVEPGFEAAEKRMPFARKHHVETPRQT